MLWVSFAVVAINIQGKLHPHATKRLSLRGEPKSGTTLVENSVYAAVQAATNGSEYLEERRRIIYASTKPGERIEFTGNTDKHLIPGFRWRKDGGCFHVQSIPSSPSGPCGIFAHEPASGIVAAIQNCFVNCSLSAKIRVHRHDSFLYVFRDPRDVVVSRCYYQMPTRINRKDKKAVGKFLSECVRKHYLATLAWVKFREMLIKYTDDHYGFVIHRLCYEDISEANKDEARKSVAWKAYLQNMLELRVTNDNVKEIRAQMAPSNIKRHASHFKWHSKGKAHPKVRSAGKTNFAGELAHDPALVADINRAYAAFEKAFTSYCADARSSYLKSFA